VKEGIVMKRKVFLLSILSIMVPAAWTLASQQTTQKQHIHRPAPPITQQIKSEQLEQIQTAVVEFTEPVKLLGAILKGDYMFLHDEGKMSRGEPCTWVYARGTTRKFDKLVVSFHCIPETRDGTADQFKLIVSATPPNRLPELLEYQFAGSSVGHRVPQPTE
jgi:hypothetical protein